MVKKNYYDLASIGLLAFISLLTLVRIGPFPQFIDGYYHLSVANSFIQSGGWVGWDWWSNAPFGRPHLYPPLYHFILVFFQYLRISAVNSVLISEFLSSTLFFLVIWHLTKKMLSSRIAFFFLVILTTFLPFYASLSENIPATISLIFGLLSMVQVKEKKLTRASILLILSFYSHSAMTVLLIASFSSVALFAKEYRKLLFRLLLISLFFTSPLLCHQLKYTNYLHFVKLNEVANVRYSFVVLVLGVISIISNLKNRQLLVLFFYGFILTSIAVFFKYSYRFFCAQGIIGIAFFAALYIDKILLRLTAEKAKIFAVIIAGYLLLFHSTLNSGTGKFNFTLFDSTCYNLVTGKIYNFFKFRPLVTKAGFAPIIDIIKANTASSDIIWSNQDVGSQILSALTQRPVSNFMLPEVLPKGVFLSYQYAKIIVWFKLPDKTGIFSGASADWHNIYENDLACVFLNTAYIPSLKLRDSKINFHLIASTLLCMSMIYFSNLLKILRKLFFS